MNIYKKTCVYSLLAIFCCFLWGSAFATIKVGYELFRIEGTGSQILFAGMRFVLAGVYVIAALCVKNKRLVYPKFKSLGMVCKISLCQTFLQYIFFYVGLAGTTAVKASLLDGASVFFAIIISSVIFRMEKLTVRKITACIVGFAGIFLININGLSPDINSGDIMLLISSVAYASSSVLIKRYSQSEDPVIISGYQFVIGGVLLCAVGLMLGGEVNTVTFKGILILMYLAFISAAAYSIWGILLKYNPVSKISVFSFTIQIFGVVISRIVLAEDITASIFTYIASLVLICGGIYILNRKAEDD